MCHSALGRLLPSGGSRGPINVQYQSHTHTNTRSVSHTSRGVSEGQVNLLSEGSVSVALAPLLITAILVSVRFIASLIYLTHSEILSSELGIKFCNFKTKCDFG